MLVKHRQLNLLDLTHLIFILAIVVGYVLGVFGSAFLAYYALVVWWLIPLTMANVVLAVTLESDTEKLDMANFVCALLTLIPIIGFLPATLGIIFSLLTLRKIFLTIYHHSSTEVD